MNVSSQYSVI